MMKHSRRTLLSAFSVAIPFGLASRSNGPAIASDEPPLIRFRSFEAAVREAFASPRQVCSSQDVAGEDVSESRWIEVGDSEIVRSGLQGCHNDRPFAGFPQGALRIVRTGFGPGPGRQGARLYVAAVEVALADSLVDQGPSRPLDFASLPAAPTFV